MSFEDNISRISPSSERMEELWVVCMCLYEDLAYADLAYADLA